MTERVTIVGGGLAGSEAAWQLARRGVGVDLYEMRPVRQTPVHQTGDFAELVCSNSLRGNALDQAAGLLKEEMRRMDSLVIRVADEVRVPAGSALAVDRGLFAQQVTEAVAALPEVTLHRAGGARASPTARSTIVATGPLTSDALAARDRRLRGPGPPLLLRRGEPGGRGRDASTSRQHVPRLALRQGRRRLRQLPARRGGVPTRSIGALTTAECAELHDFEKEFFFEGCLPVEVIASRGPRHAALRAHEAGGPRRPAHRAAPLRGRAAPPGQPRGQPLLAGGLPDPAQVGRAEARLPDDPGPGEGRVRALRA